MITLKWFVLPSSAFSRSSLLQTDDDLFFCNVAGDLRLNLKTWVAMISLEVYERQVNDVYIECVL